MSIIRSLSTAVAASGLPLERGGSRVVGRGPAGWPDHDQQPRYHHAPNDGREDVQNMLSCT